MGMGNGEWGMENGEWRMNFFVKKSKISVLLPLLPVPSEIVVKVHIPFSKHYI